MAHVILPARKSPLGPGRNLRASTKYVNHKYPRVCQIPGEAKCEGSCQSTQDHTQKHSRTYCVSQALRTSLQFSQPAVPWSSHFLSYNLLHTDTPYWNGIDSSSLGLVNASFIPLHLNGLTDPYRTTQHNTPHTHTPTHTDTHTTNAHIHTYRVATGG